MSEIRYALFQPGDADAIITIAKQIADARGSTATAIDAALLLTLASDKALDTDPHARPPELRRQDLGVVT